MSWKIVLHPSASKQLRSLPTAVDDRIRSKLTEMITNEWRDLMDYDVDTISGTKYKIYRTRIGGYRVIFFVDEPIAAILDVSKREGAYGNVGKLDDRARDLFK